MKAINFDKIRKYGSMFELSCPRCEGWAEVTVWSGIRPGQFLFHRSVVTQAACERFQLEGGDARRYIRWLARKSQAWRCEEHF